MKEVKPEKIIKYRIDNTRDWLLLSKALSCLKKNWEVIQSYAKE